MKKKHELVKIAYLNRICRQCAGTSYLCNKGKPLNTLTCLGCGYKLISYVGFKYMLMEVKKRFLIRI